MKLNQRAPIGVEVLCYSPVRQQWCTAFNANGTIERLIIRDWFSSKHDALLDLKNALRFREGLVADCESICRLIDKVDQQLREVSRET